jgi:hypothetical protein
MNKQKKEETSTNEADSLNLQENISTLSPDSKAITSVISFNESSKLRSIYDENLTKIQYNFDLEIQKIIKDSRRQYNDFLKKFQSLKSDINLIKDDFEKQIHNTELRSIQVIGIIASLISLVLVFANSAIQQKSLSQIVIIFTMTTATLILFNGLIDLFFNFNKKTLFNIIISIFFTLLTPLVAIVFFIYKFVKF